MKQARKISQLNQREIWRLLIVKPTNAVKSWLKRAGLPQVYVISALLILVASTLLWSYLGAKLQQSNADQLVNTYLVQNSATWHGALIPASHTFLLKWPLFWWANVLGASANVFIWLTVITCLATVGALAAIIYRFERRPFVFGTLVLALASVLLLVPTVPAAGSLLPANFAMLATRNIEYIIYLLSLWLLLRSNKLKSFSFIVGIGLLALLGASDKLFLTLSLGGAAIALIVYALNKGWNLVSLSVNWLVSGLLASATAMLLLWFLNAHKILHLVSQSKYDPYGLVHSFHDAVLGLIYGMLALLTNLGADPGSDTTVLKDWPSRSLHGLFSLSGPAYLLNLLILGFGVWAIYKIVRLSLAHNKDKNIELPQLDKFGLMLTLSSLSALAAFVFTRHYYAGDARYLAIFMFSVFISLAALARRYRLSDKRLLLCGSLLTVGMLLSLPRVVNSYHNNHTALANYDQRNKNIAEVLRHHSVDVLVGDYWRVVPIRLASSNAQDIMPLAGCTDPRQDLTSTSWQPNLANHRFAYLLSLDGNLTDYPNCGLDQVIKAYGRPNNSVVIDGKQDNPKELLLFYDRGANKSAPTVKLTVPSTVLPIGLSDLPYTSCPTGINIMNITAHQDDDLLFMNPDTIRSFKNGDCIRSVYITAGDAGGNNFYWLGREQGSQAAYSQMLGSSEIWVQRVVKLDDNRYIYVTHPRGDYRVSLIFLRLPDGNLNGQGFHASLYESLEKLDGGKIEQMRTVDDQSTFTLEQLQSALAALMHAYLPAEIRTQANLMSNQFPDHSDHRAVGRITTKAADKYFQAQFEGKHVTPIKYYVGYPIHARPENISGDELKVKEAAFLEYARHDFGVCQTREICESNSTAYGFYLPRQYTTTP